MDLLTLKNFYEDFAGLVSEIESDRNQDDARFTLRFIEKRILVDRILQQTNKDLLDGYTQLAGRLRVVALENLLVTEVPPVFSHDIASALNQDLSLLKKSIDSYFVRFTTDDQLKKQRTLMINGLLGNKQRLTTESIIADDGKSIAPTVGNWVKYFYIQVGGQERSSRLKVAEFFSSNKNIIALSSEEKQRVKNLVDLQEYLRRPLAEIAIQAASVIVDMGNDTVAHFENGELVEYNPKPETTVDIVSSEPTELPEIVEQKEREVHELRPVQHLPTGKIEYVEVGKEVRGRQKEVQSVKEKQVPSPILSTPSFDTPIAKDRLPAKKDFKESGTKVTAEPLQKKSIQAISNVPAPISLETLKRDVSVSVHNNSFVEKSFSKNKTPLVSEKQVVKKEDIQNPQAKMVEQKPASYNNESQKSLERPKRAPSLTASILEKRNQAQSNISSSQDIQESKSPVPVNIASPKPRLEQGNDTIVIDAPKTLSLADLKSRLPQKRSPQPLVKMQKTLSADSSREEVQNVKTTSVKSFAKPLPSSDIKNTVRVTQSLPSEGQVTIKERMRLVYDGDKRESVVLETKLHALKEQVGDDGKELFNTLLPALQGRDKMDIIAGLYRLAQIGKLSVLESNKKIHEIVVSSVAGADPIQGLDTIIKVLLQNYLGFTEFEAARFALHISEKSKESGNQVLKQIAYFDVSSGQFKWN